jgi:hypothetical protein
MTGSEGPMLNPGTSAFDVYGFRFTIRGTSPWAVESLSQDFAFFRSSPIGGEQPIEMLEGDPDYDLVPVREASVYTPRNVAYRNGKTIYLDYHGRGLGIHDPSAGGFRIVGRDPHLLYEASYLFLLSRIGEYLDQKGMHRIHALAVSMGGRAILVLLPMGGGKSTLGGHLLQHEGVKLMSDDSPFVGASGRIHAFPLHLGLLPGANSEVPEQHRRLVHRMEFGPKILVNYEYFAEKVCDSAEPGIVFLGSRTLAPDCRIEPAGMAAGVRAMIANSVVGLGLFHGLEFILQRSAWELLGNFNVGCSRLGACLRLLRRSRIQHLRLGRNPEANAAAVVEFSRHALS